MIKHTCNEKKKMKHPKHVHWCDDVEIFYIDRIDDKKTLHDLFYHRRDYDKFEREATEEEILCFSDDEEEEDEELQSIITLDTTTPGAFDRWASGNESISSLSSDLENSSGSITQPNIPSRRPSPTNLGSFIVDNNDSQNKKESCSSKDNNTSANGKRTASAGETVVEPNVLLAPHFDNERIDINSFTGKRRITDAGANNQSYSCNLKKTNLINGPPCCPRRRGSAFASISSHEDTMAGVDADADSNSCESNPQQQENPESWLSPDQQMDSRDDDNKDGDCNSRNNGVVVESLIADLKDIIKTLSVDDGADKTCYSYPPHRPLSPSTSPDTPTPLPPGFHRTTSLGELEKIRKKKKKKKEQLPKLAKIERNAQSHSRRHSLSSINNIYPRSSKTSSRRTSVEGPELQFLISRGSLMLQREDL